ncbi:hypothetical protein K438DRAFT_2103329 [Mycena galopus ATCC 62051]|nr:hypothetical protein K438DRAFT_2103329 [Mycena galopus ATCC 62051]
MSVSSKQLREEKNKIVRGSGRGGVAGYGSGADMLERAQLVDGYLAPETGSERVKVVGTEKARGLGHVDNGDLVLADIGLGYRRIFVAVGDGCQGVGRRRDTVNRAHNEGAFGGTHAPRTFGVAHILFVRLGLRDFDMLTGNPNHHEERLEVVADVESTYSTGKPSSLGVSLSERDTGLVFALNTNVGRVYVREIPVHGWHNVQRALHVCMPEAQPDLFSAALPLTQAACKLTRLSWQKAKSQTSGFLPPTFASDDDDAATAKPARKPTPAVMTSSVASKSKSKPKPKKAATDNEEDDVLPSQSDDDKESESVSQSSNEDESLSNMLDERAEVIPRGSMSSSPMPEDDVFDLPHRCRTSSSVGSAPPDTDFDLDTNDNGQEDTSEPDVVDPPSPKPMAKSSGKDHRRSPSPHRIAKGSKKPVTAQQSKYNEENPTIHAKQVLHAAPEKEYVETDWDNSARINFPVTGGQIKLLKQSTTLQAVLKATFDYTAYQMAFKTGYDSGTSRTMFAAHLIRICAQKIRPQAKDIGKRAKKDKTFCARLAPLVYESLILFSLTELHCGYAPTAISKVATHYELNKAGVTPSHVKAIVKLLLAHNSFIFPYTAPPAATAQDSAVANVNDTLVDDTFDIKSPFLAPAIIDIIHEAWWNNRKVLGFAHVKELKSNQIDLPAEVVLPDPMICLTGANIWAALVAYQTGVFIPPPEFSQARLDGTYNSLLDTLEKQRNGDSKKKFNKLMNTLYLKVS